MSASEHLMTPDSRTRLANHQCSGAWVQRFVNPHLPNQSRPI